MDEAEAAQRMQRGREAMAQLVRRTQPQAAWTRCPICHAVRVCGERLYYDARGEACGCEDCLETRFV